MTASLRGRMKHREKLRVLVGDVVTLTEPDEPDDGYVIEGIAPRRTLLKRRAPGKTRGVRPVAANIDRVIVVGAAAAPDWDQHLMDRFVVVAEASEIPVVVVVNKIDLVTDPDKLLHVYDGVGYRTIATSAKTGKGVEALQEVVRRGASLFTGPTGVGKSSLLNAIAPDLRLRTAEVSRKSKAGRHTTVQAEMFGLGDGAYLVDTPGLRDIGLWGVDREDVGRAFPEIMKAASGCKFDNCRHVAEPDCAVAELARRGDIVPERLESYRRFLAEAMEAGKHWK